MCELMLSKKLLTRDISQDNRQYLLERHVLLLMESLVCEVDSPRQVAEIIKLRKKTTYGNSLLKRQTGGKALDG